MGWQAVADVAPVRLADHGSRKVGGDCCVGAAPRSSRESALEALSDGERLTRLQLGDNRGGHRRDSNSC